MTTNHSPSAATATNPTRLRKSGTLAVVIALGLVAGACGSELRASSTPVRSESYDHDSRILETPTVHGYSYFHDSRINDARSWDTSNTHDSRING